jgi:hypothetical protein
VASKGVADQSAFRLGLSTSARVDAGAAFIERHECLVQKVYILRYTSADSRSRAGI